MRLDPAFAARLLQAFRRTGYWNAKKDRPDLFRFAVEKHYVPQYLYKWTEGRVPEAPNVLRLCQDLGLDPYWLIFGEARSAADDVTRPAQPAIPPTAGASASLGGSRRRRLR